MTNPYFNWTNPLPRRQTARSEAVNSGFEGAAAGFDLLPHPDAISAGTVNFAVDTGTADAMQVSLPRIETYVDGLLVRVRKGPANNTGAMSMQVNALGMRAIRRPDGSQIGPGDVRAGSQHTLVYDEPNARWTLQTVTQADVNNAAASATSAAASALAAATDRAAAAGSASAAAISAANAGAIVQSAIGPVRAHHIGADPPAGAEAGWIWLDTSTVPASLRMRNAAGNAWITILTETVGPRTLLGNSGATAAPALPLTLASLVAALALESQMIGDPTAILTAGDVLVSASGARRVRRADVLLQGMGGGPGTLALNIIRRNIGALATVTASRFTLPIGTYEIQASSAIRLSTGIGGLESCSSQLRNVTTNEFLGPVVGGRSDSPTSAVEGTSLFDVSVVGAPNEFELHGARDNANWSWTRQAASAHASAPIWSQQVAIWKVA
jgi:hypothetical protein